MRSSRQLGASLISIMIGLLVSSMCILAVMTMHKGLVGVAIQSKSDAVHDGLITSAMVQLQLELQNAGFGMETATASDVVATTLGTSPALLWRYIDAGNLTCRGVLEKSYTDADAGTDGRQLVQIENTAACTAAADLTTLNWTEIDTLARFRNRAAQLFTFNVAQADCAPFGFGVSASHLQVTVSAPSSAVVAGAASVSAINYQYCLSNTHL